MKITTTLNAIFLAVVAVLIANSAQAEYRNCNIIAYGNPKSIMCDEIDVSSLSTKNCSGNSCVLSTYFQLGTVENSVTINGIKIKSMTSAFKPTMNFGITLSNIGSVVPGQSFVVPTNFSGEVTGVGMSFYDTPPIVLTSSGWTANHLGLPVYNCVQRLAEALFFAEDLIETANSEPLCALANNIEHTYTGKWTDVWKAYSLNAATGQWDVPQNSISCTTSSTGTDSIRNATCTQSTSFSGRVKLTLKRTMSSTNIEGLSDNYIFAKSKSYFRPLNFQKAFPATMEASIFVNMGCVPTLTIPSACLDPDSSPTVSWSSCGTGNYDVEFRDQQLPGQTQAFTVASPTVSYPIPNTLLNKDRAVEYRVRKNTGIWSDWSAVRVGKAASVPTIITNPLSVPSGENLLIGWRYSDEDVTKERVGDATAVINGQPIVSAPAGNTFTKSVNWTAPEIPGQSSFVINTEHPLYCGSSTTTSTGIEVISATREIRVWDITSPATPSLLTNGATISFGNVGITTTTPKIKKFKITNNGNAQLDITGLILTPDPNDDFSILNDSLQPSIGPNSTTERTFDVKFAPKTILSKLGTITISSNDNTGSNSSFVLNLNGTGTKDDTPEGGGNSSGGTNIRDL
jgi:hypothetical protein